MSAKDDGIDAKTPGESLGFYAVTGTLGAETCGAESLSAPRTWSFQVKLSRDGSALYWLNGREAIVGQIDESGRFAFDTHLEIPIAPKRGAAKGCTMVRRDAADGALSDAQDAFAASLSFAYEQTAASDCSEWLTGVAGVPEALPCRLGYSLKAERVSD